MPDMFSDEKPTVTISSANMAQYADRLSDGVMDLMQRYGFSINVYPTHRTAAAPQWVYDNIAQNAVNAQPNPKGIRYGFSGAYGGVPFPIPSTDENQGGEIIWNHICRWAGSGYVRTVSGFIVSSGSVQETSNETVTNNIGYYDPKGSAATFDGYLEKFRLAYNGPPALEGQVVIEYDPTNPLQQPQEIWELLQGQGRVRKAPELAYDTPAISMDGLANYDEFFGFFGAPDRYDWKCLGKKEMYIPYNNNGIFFHEPSDVIGPHFVNPQYLRWELHRVWVVEATLAPGERDVVPRRKFYIDEDTWIIGANDEWDAKGNLWKINMNLNQVRPDLPGTLFATQVIYNIQSNQYAWQPSPWADPQYGKSDTFGINPANVVNPNTLAAQAQF